jgi:hypothetical protein
LSINPGLKDIFRSLWKDFNTTFEDILGRIRSHKDLILDKATALHIQAGQFTTNMQDIRNHIQGYEQGWREFLRKEEIRKEAMFNETREWIASVDIESEHSNICYDRQRYQNSGDWILSHEKVKNWLSPDRLTHSILWINGRPGTGT